MVERMMMDCCLISLSPLSPPPLPSSSTTTPFFLTRLHSRPSSILRVSSRLKNGLESDKRARLLEKYGLDPAEYMDTSTDDDFSSKGRKRKGKGRGTTTTTEKMVRPEEPKPPRTTHQLLQVLGGQARRKKLLSPKGADVRPMMAVVRGAAFDILQAAGGCPTSLRPGRWLDLYSGTGSVGIEAMSRGCCEAHFVEMDPWVVSEVLKPNLESTGFQDVSVIHTVQVEKFLENASRHPGKHECFDYVSVTPPYTAVSYDVLMDQLAQSPLVGEDTFVLVEYPSRTLMEESCGPLLKITDRRFGRTYFAIYGPLWSQKKRMS